MEINPQTSDHVQAEVKKELTIRKVLNIYGIFTLISTLLSIYTIPIFINKNLKIVRNEELVLQSERLIEFLIFIFIAALSYFICVNYVLREKSK